MSYGELLTSFAFEIFVIDGRERGRLPNDVALLDAATTALSRWLADLSSKASEG